MASTLSIPLQIVITLEVHEVEGGGFWAEVPRFPGCVAQADTIEATEGEHPPSRQGLVGRAPREDRGGGQEARGDPGSDELPDVSYPRPYEYLPPPSWSDEDE